MRRLLAAIALLLTSFLNGNTAVRDPISALPPFTPAWRDLKLGAGGQITSISISPDATTLIRTDTGGGYVYEPTGTCTLGGNVFAAQCWRQLATTVSLPSRIQTYPQLGDGNVGVVEVVACQSNTNVLYMIWNTTLYVSTNRGVTWTATPQTTTQNSNANSTKANSPYLYCDPANPDIIYVSTPSSGVFKSTNGRSGAGATFARVTAVGAATRSQGHVFASDPASSVVGNVTQHFWICTFGTGCYETTNGGTSFAVTASSPTAFYHIVCDQFSQLWLVDQTNGLHRYVSSWSTMSTPTIGSGGPTSIAVDPTSASLGTNHVVIAGFNGQIASSANNGRTWSGFFANETYSASVSQPGWLGSANQGGPGNNSDNTLNIAIDPSGNLWKAAGIGVWTTPAPIAANNTIWSANSVGIEQLVVNQVIVPPGNSPLTAVWDRGVFLNANPDVFPSIQFTNAISNIYGSVHQIMGGWGVDWAGGTANFITAWLASNLDSSRSPASSSDGGHTWTVWPTLPAETFFGGSVAAATSKNWIVVPGRNEKIYFTIDGGANWASSRVSGSPTNWLTEINQGPAIAADRVMIGNFCAVTRSQVFYSSTDGGANFSATGATSASVDGSPNLAFLVSVPGQAGNYFYTAGGNSNPPPNGAHLWKSTDSCATWKKVSANLQEVLNIGFGAHKPGAAGSYPTIYVNGWLNRVQGFYQSIDGGATWTPISVPAGQGVWPQTTVDFVSSLSGDPNVYGRIYVGFNGTGAAYIDTADACPWVNFSSVNPNASLTGTVTLTAQHSGLVPVTSVQFSVDGTNIGSAQTGDGPYSVEWVTGDVADGPHTLSVQAIGNGCSTAGNSFTIPISTH
jgi:Bacterial Ig domain